MVSKELIMATLAGIAVTGAVPLIIALGLLAMKKIRASSFWAGVLAFVVGFLVYSIASAVVSGVMAATGGADMDSMMGVVTEQANTLSAILGIAMGVVFSLAMGICIGKCMKTRTFNAAVSCGLGFGISYTMITAISLLSSYTTYSQINSGQFEQQYAVLVERGMMTKETVKMLKESVINTTAPELVTSIIVNIAAAVLFVSAAIFIMRSVCDKKTYLGVGAVIMLFILQLALPSVISNQTVGMIISVAVCAVSLFIALRMKDSITPPDKPNFAGDSFMQSIESVINYDDFDPETGIAIKKDSKE